MNSSYFGSALRAGSIVGSFDISAAMLQYWLKTGKDPLIVPKYVASGALGKEAVTGGPAMIVAGLLFHYFIATCFAIFFFWLYERWSFMAKNKILTGVLYGIFMSEIMQGIVVPSSRITTGPFNLINSLIAAAILMVCIGIPLGFLAARAQTNKVMRSASVV